MLQVELQDHEVPILQQLLDAELSDLHTEIHHTDNRQYKEELKEKQAALTRILGALSPRSAPSA